MSNTLLQKPSVVFIFWIIPLLFSMTAAKASDFEEVEFLPVDEAYLLSYYLDDNEIVIDLAAAPGYYLYRDKFKVSSKTLELKPHYYSDNVEEVYDPNFDEVMAIFHDAMIVRVPLNLNATGKHEFNFVYQGCADAGLCYPPQKKAVSLDLNSGDMSLIEKTKVSGAQVDGNLDFTVDSENSVPQTAELNLVTAVTAAVAAFLGGMLLNLMPCVFPVLSIKALQISQLGGESGETRSHGWVYTFGVVISFVSIAALLIFLRQFGDWIGWGFQLQSPYFVAFLTLLFLTMGLNMAGYFEFGYGLMGIGQNLTHKSGKTGTFFTGVLAVLVATPCTAPFMGSAIGFALSQPAYVSLIIFAAMGLGLAFPVLLIGLIPGFARVLPKPGGWMTTFKEFLAFPLYATALWLLWVLVEIQGTDALISTGMGLIVLGFSLWHGLGVKPNEGRGMMVFKRTVRTAAIFVAVGMVLNQQTQTDPWDDYSPVRLSELQSFDQPVFVDVTAAWCITCKTNKKIALSGDAFHALVKEKGVQLLVADWTNPSPEVDALINEYGRNGVPLYLFYKPGATRAEVLPQILTPSVIEEMFASI